MRPCALIADWNTLECVGRRGAALLAGMCQATPRAVAPFWSAAGATPLWLMPRVCPAKAVSALRSATALQNSARAKNNMIDTTPRLWAGRADS